MAANWLNENSQRQYPFVPAEELTLLDGVTPVVLPNSLILDFGAILYPDAGFVDETDMVYLALITRAGSTFTFVFTQTAAASYPYVLSFDRTVGDNEYATEHADSGLLGGTGVCDDEPVWSGFLTTGDLAPLEELLPGNGTLTGGDHLKIEPARLQNLAQKRVRSISLANAPRVRVDQLFFSAGSSTAVDTENGYTVNERCLQGDLKLGLGFNCEIIQNLRENSLTLTSRVGAGAGEPCEEYPLYEGEPMPDGFTYTGGPQCKDVMGWLNGIKGPVINIVGGTGIRVYPDTDPHTLMIDADMHDLTNCTPPVLGEFGGNPDA
jgi:hypothetical protein